MTWDKVMIPYAFCRGPASRLGDGEFRVLVAMWCLAGRSPVRGSLMLTNELALSPADIAREAPATEANVGVAIAALLELGELETDLAGVLRFTRWSEINPTPRRSDTREAWAERKRRQRESARVSDRQAEAEGRAPQLVITERPLHVLPDVFPAMPAGGRRRDQQQWRADAQAWLDRHLPHVPLEVAAFAATRSNGPATPGALAAHPYVVRYAPPQEATG